MDVSVGVSLYNSQAFNIGLNVGGSLKNFYLDISSNLKGGEGDRLHFNTDTTYNTNRDLIFLINTGFNIRIKEKWFIIPIIGVGRTWDIYQSNGTRYRYFYRNSTSFINIGLSTKFFINDDVGLIVGGGSNELFKVSIVYKL